MCQTLVTLLSAVSALSGPAPEQALKIALEAQGLIPAGVVSLGDWFTQASDSFKDAADSEELAAELDAQGIPVLLDQQYGVSSVNDVITQDTVR